MIMVSTKLSALAALGLVSATEGRPLGTGRRAQPTAWGASSDVFNVVDYGAVGDGRSVLAVATWLAHRNVLKRCSLQCIFCERGVTCGAVRVECVWQCGDNGTSS